jgi:RHS repeat-associated protein
VCFIYGRSESRIEQINNSTGTVQYLHHDQAGSPRLLTGSTGKTEATFTYGPYGGVTGSTGTATTRLGYDGQYTSSDTGLIYLRDRVYDPATAQFLTGDPAVSITRAPYNYAGDNPLTYRDRSASGSKKSLKAGRVSRVRGAQPPKAWQKPSKAPITKPSTASNGSTARSALKSSANRPSKAPVQLGQDVNSWKRMAPARSTVKSRAIQILNGRRKTWSRWPKIYG